MFKSNKYTNWYYSIIKYAQSQQRNKSDNIFYERHHIIPKSFGGTNESGNLVLLTLKEHYICHLLLTKMTEGNERNKMIWALHRMMKRDATANQYKLSRQIFINHKKNRSLSEEHKRKISKSLMGDNNPMRKNPIKDSFRLKMSEIAKNNIKAKERLAIYSANQTVKSNLRFQKIYDEILQTGIDYNQFGNKTKLAILLGYSNKIILKAIRIGSR